jgi:hypothetical protein
MDGVLSFWTSIFGPQPTFVDKDGNVWRLMPDMQRPDMITAAREQFFLSHRELSRVTGVSESMLRLIEKRQRAFTVRIVSKFWPNLIAYNNRLLSWETPEMLKGMIQ